MNPFDFIGYYGPIIIIVTTIMVLWSLTKILFLYALCLIINTYINGLLKILIREPRPSGNRVFDEYEKTSGQEIYGMPSGHAQSAAFSTTFLYLFTKSSQLLMGTLFVSTLTLYQRYKFNRHTPWQLAIGTIIGALIAVIANKIYICNV